MTSPDLDAAANFLAANGRVLERRVFERVFTGAGPAPVRDAIAAYRNCDGGFGHALEPDGRCPDSQPLAAELALRTMHEADAFDTGLVSDACDWLAARAPLDGGVTFVEAGIEGWPHAPWWVPEPGQPASLITTGLIAGTLHARQIAHPWLDRATDLLWERIGTLTQAGPYDLRAVLRFLDHVPDRVRAREAVLRLEPLIAGAATLDPHAAGETHSPLDFAPRPSSLAHEVFGAEVIAAHLDHLAGAQREDGGWMFNWPAWSPAAEREWRGAVTVEALLTLRAYGRCPAAPVTGGAGHP